MRWLWFVGSLVCFAVLFRTTSIALALICLVGALVFMLIGTLAVAAQRIDRSRNADLPRFNMDELQRNKNAATEPAPASQPLEPAIVGMASAAAMIENEMRNREPVMPPSETGWQDETDTDPE